MQVVQSLDSLAEIVRSVIDAGATVINIPDTVGYATPVEYWATFSVTYVKMFHLLIK